MTTINILLLLAFGAPLLFLVVLFVIDYSKATGTVWVRLLAASRDSATVFWMKAVAAASMVLGLSDQASTALGTPEAGKLIAAIPAQYVAAAGILIAFIGFLARLRSLSSH